MVGPSLADHISRSAYPRRTRKHQEKNGATVTANLLTGLGIDEFFTRTEGGSARSLLPDALGSTVALGDGTGTLQTQYTYEPFGITSQTGTASTNSYKYTGREDDGTALLYYRARYYSPRMGRFVSEDPIGFLGGDVNLYAYVGGNPISRMDAYGLYWFRQPWQAMDPIVGRANTIVPPGGPISSFIEEYVPAGRTLAEIHDPLVDSLTRAGIPDAVANIPTMPFAYGAAVLEEILRSLGLKKQPMGPCKR